VSDLFYGKTNTTGKNFSAAGLATLAKLTKGNNDTSEDCLTINVWTKPQTGEKKKAVVIWANGKGYVTGSSSDPVYDGQHIVNEQDIILVTFK
jgi:carboxylesterase type B